MRPVYGAHLSAAGFGASQSTLNSSNGLIGSGGARVFQFGLKFLF